jgi:hypothetical protein
MISVEIRGLNQLNGFLTNLPRELRTELNKESGNFMMDVRKSAKLRAPRDTGELANSIIVYEEGKGNWVLEVQSPHGGYQEEGFRPHFIYSNNGMVMGRKSNKFWADGLHWVSKHTPFVQPALERNLSNLSQRMSEATTKSIRKSQGGTR